MRERSATRLRSWWLAVLVVVAVGISLSACVDESACQACIDEQMDLRRELIDEGYEPEGSLESPAYYREACKQQVIALDQPCAPSYSPRLITFAVIAAAIAFSIVRRMRARGEG